VKRTVAVVPDVVTPVTVGAPGVVTDSTVKLRVTWFEGAYVTELTTPPSADAVNVQVPAATSVTVRPSELTVHLAGVADEYLTGRPALLVAVCENAPIAWSAGWANVTTCGWPTAMLSISIVAPSACPPDRSNVPDTKTNLYVAEVVGMVTDARCQPLPVPAGDMSDEFVPVASTISVCVQVDVFNK